MSPGNSEAGRPKTTGHPTHRRGSATSGPIVTVAIDVDLTATRNPGGAIWAALTGAPAGADVSVIVGDRHDTPGLLNLACLLDARTVTVRGTARAAKVWRSAIEDGLAQAAAVRADSAARAAGLDVSRRTWAGEFHA